MRKIIFVTAIFGAMLMSCAKNEIPEQEEEWVTEPTDAEIVEGIMTESLAAISDQTESISPGINAALEFFTVAIPNYGIQTLMEPIVEQIMDCWKWSGLEFGLSNIHGHFAGGFEMWNYTEAEDLQFTYKGRDNKQNKIQIVASEEITESPLYEEWPLTITLPQEVETTVSVADKEILSTVLNTEYSVDGRDTSANFKIGIYSTSDNTGFANVKYEKEGNSLSALNIEYNIIDKEGNGLFGLSYNYDWILFDQIDVTMGSRVRISAGTLNLAAYFTALVGCNASLKEDQSEENIESIRETLDSLNDICKIRYYLDEEEEGTITLELIQDNGIYQVDAVMTYEEDGSKYQIPGLVSSISDLYDSINTIIDFTNRIIDFIIEYVKEQVTTTN